MKIQTTLLMTLSICFTCGVTSHALAAEATKTKSDRACVFASQPQDWRVLDNQHLVLWASQNNAYLVTLFSPLNDLHFTESLAFIDDDHDGMICSGDKIGIPDSHTASFPATITNMRRITDSELIALGEQYKVKLVTNKKAQQIKSHDKQLPAEPTAAKAE
jgi:Family of unknown function (DUF6491)